MNRAQYYVSYIHLFFHLLSRIFIFDFVNLTFIQLIFTILTQLSLNHSFKLQSFLFFHIIRQIHYSFLKSNSFNIT